MVGVRAPSTFAVHAVRKIHTVNVAADGQGQSAGASRGGRGRARRRRNGVTERDAAAQFLERTGSGSGSGRPGSSSSSSSRTLEERMQRYHQRQRMQQEQQLRTQSLLPAANQPQPRPQPQPQRPFPVAKPPMTADRQRARSDDVTTAAATRRQRVPGRGRDELFLWDDDRRDVGGRASETFFASRWSRGEVARLSREVDVPSASGLFPPPPQSLRSIAASAASYSSYSSRRSSWEAGDDRAELPSQGGDGGSVASRGSDADGGSVVSTGGAGTGAVRASGSRPDTPSMATFADIMAASPDLLEAQLAFERKRKFLSHVF